MRLLNRSPSTRRAWIEIACRAASCAAVTVALHPEGVDRNEQREILVLRKLLVALHPEGVDRNSDATKCSGLNMSSPSTRRAWIEIWL